MTYNIRGGLGMDGRRSIQRIADVALAHAPDVICFQEVHQRLPWTRFADHPRQLQKSLGMPVMFYPTVRFGMGGFGLGIATRLPILSIQRHALPSRREQRGALEVQLKWKTEAFSVFCTHWGLNAQERLEQAAYLSSIINRVSSDLIVLCGDLNERPDGAAVRDLVAQTQLQDAGISENTPTYPADLPNARIDYIFCSEQMQAVKSETAASNASDHLPFVVDFA